MHGAQATAEAVWYLRRRTFRGIGLQPQNLGIDCCGEVLGTRGGDARWELRLSLSFCISSAALVGRPMVVLLDL